MSQDYGEPWKVSESTSYTVDGRDGRPLLFPWSVHDDGTNSRRIVCCVNALAGVSAPEKAVRELREIVAEFVGTYEDIEGVTHEYMLEELTEREKRNYYRARAALANFK